MLTILTIVVVGFKLGSILGDVLLNERFPDLRSILEFLSVTGPLIMVGYAWYIGLFM